MLYFVFFAHFDSLDMLDKVEPPLIPDGFGISVAYACLLDIVRSISLAVLGPSKVKPLKIVKIKL